MSYLNTPRLTFAGKFQADPSTVNNDVTHFDNANFKPSYQEYGPGATNGWWNPDGTGNWRFIDCVVTSVTYKDGSSTSDPALDPVIGMSIMDANTRVAGKIVDLDPQQQSVSELWGLIVRIWDGEKNLMKSNFKPIAFNNIWWIRSLTQQADGGASAAYQSVLRNIEWSDAITASRYLRELKETSPDELSIKFNVDMYMGDHTKASFTLGRIVGGIGPAHINEPRHFVMGRQLFPILTYNSNIPGYLPLSGDKGNIYFATAIVEKDLKRIVLDLGNSLQTTGINGTIAESRKLMLAVRKGTADYEILGPINYSSVGWYESSGGLVQIDIDENQVADALAYPLAVVVQNSDYSITSLLNEVTDYVRADNFVYRLDPGESATINLYASRLGNPLQDQTINYQQQNNLIAIMGQTSPNGPDTGTPDTVLSFNTSSQTDENGKTSVLISAGDPQNPRGYVDGQVYALAYNINGQPSENFDPPPQELIGINPNDFVSVLVHDSVDPSVIAAPTWDNLQPIMQQYANLYPLMSKGIFNLANKEVVDQNAVLLKFAFGLPIEDPNYMPATRDLSGGNKQMILNYLDAVIKQA
jgi:hypothetical protein